MVEEEITPIDIEQEEIKEEPSEITQGEYITLYDKQKETILLKLLKDSFILEVRRAFDNLVWKKEYTMEALVKLDPVWSVVLTDIAEVAAYINYSFQNSNFNFTISLENLVIISFELDFGGFKTKEMKLIIEPKTKNMEEALSEHAQILRELSDKMDTQAPPETAEAVADLTNRITKIETYPPIAFHKIFRLTTSSWNFTNTNFTDFPAAKGVLELTYPAFVKWELFLNGCYTNQVTRGSYHCKLRIRLTSEGEGEIFSPDANGSKFRIAGQDQGGSNTYGFNESFTDVIELNPGTHQVQLQLAISASNFYWNSGGGEINLLFIAYPRIQ